LLAAAASLILTAALGACVVPALAAARLDPVAALKKD
jgi:ABC-type antimicrobial peptide transport system permease subunit